VIGASSLITITLATTIAYIGHLSGGKAFSLSSYVGTVNGFRSRVAGAARRAPVSLASVIPLPISRVEPSPTRETPSRLPAPSVDYLLENLRDSSRTVSWTIPAGLTNTQIALLWQHKGFGTGLEFLSALNDPRLLADFGLAPPMSDGWILAGTVRFAQGSSAGSVVRQLLTTFRDETTALFAEAANRYPNLSQKHILTLASIIEKEAGSLSERRKVSSVFHNRLRRGMRLQAEPTIAYALGHPRRPLRPSDRRAQSAFNTYHVVGLPPSPICNVSYESILAAVTPEKTTHLFFDVGENGSNRYSDSYDEHVVPNVADEDMTRIAQTP
jgi:cell division protein YceG involved in septum cleavage